MERRVRWTLIIQALMTVIVTAGFAVFHGGFAAFSALYGGAITLVGTWWMARGIERAGVLLAADYPDRGTRVLYRALVQKYLVIIAILAIGMGLLKLSPVPLLVGFVATQAGFLFAALGAPWQK